MNPLYPILFNLNVFILLTFLHVYWLMGGKTGAELAFHQIARHIHKPEIPSKQSLLIRALLLGGIALFSFLQISSFSEILKADTITWGNRTIAFLFGLRALGFFNYVGLTKTYTKGKFAQIDYYIYSPICVILAICALLA